MKKQVLIISVLCVAVSLYSAGRKYIIKIDRIAYAGFTEKVHKKVEALMYTEFMKDGSTLQKTEEKYKGVLKATARILTVKNGEIDTIRYNIDVFTVYKNGDLMISAPKGSYVISSDKKKQLFNEKGELLHKIDGPYDIIFIDSASLDNSDTDAVLGPGRAVSIGESWKVNSKRFADSFTKDGIMMKKEDIRGNGKLVEIVRKGNNSFYIVKIDVDIDSASMGAMKEFNLINSKTFLKFNLMLNLDNRSFSLKNDYHFSMEGIYAAKTDNSMRMKFKMEAKTWSL